MYASLHHEIKELAVRATVQTERKRPEKYLWRWIGVTLLAGIGMVLSRDGVPGATLSRITNAAAMEAAPPPEHNRYIVLTDPLALQELTDMTVDQRAEIYKPLVTEKAYRYKLDPAVFMSQIEAESRFLPHIVSPAGAVGLGQLMPETADELGVTDSYDPVANIEGSARYMRQQLDSFNQDIRTALAAYNAGPGNVMRYGGVPPFAETEGYIAKIFSRTIVYSGATCIENCS